MGARGTARGRAAWVVALAARTVALAAAVAACSSNGPAPASDAGAAPPTASTAAAPAPPRPAPREAPRPVVDANPLGLPPHRVKLDSGRRAFTFPDTMLAGAKLGSTMVLQAATVSGFDGDDLVIEGRAGPSYKVHPGYVIAVPDDSRVKPGDCVITEWNGVLKHAVVVKMTKEARPVVRYTDLDGKAAEVPLAKNARVMRQTEGLQPGNYAALRQGTELKHVLLVSLLEGRLADAGGDDPADKRWFALGFGGSATIVSEAALTPIPIRTSPKVGARVLAEWVGTMREATVQAAPDPGIFTVKFDRAGRPETVGYGLLMPLAGAR